MVKKTMNSLFLNYLLQSQDNIEANVEKWTKDFNIAENIDEISETLNEHMVFIMACWGEIGWCLPKWKEQEIKLGKVLNDLKNNIPINNIDEGLLYNEESKLWWDGQSAIADAYYKEKNGMELP